MAVDIAKRMRSVQAAVDTLQILKHDPPNEVTEQYGYLKFDENEVKSSTRLSQFIRLSLDTNAETVVKFIQQGWGLPSPDLIISVTGGAKNFDMSARLKKIFQRGLVAAAITTNAWLITAGTNAGVVKEVGEALNNYRYKNEKHGLDVPCIGIGSWGYTAENDQLAHESTLSGLNMTNAKAPRALLRHRNNQAVHAVRMEVGDQYCVRNYIVKKRPEKRCDLEANHSHFILLDNGHPDADSVLPLRAEIEKRCRHINLKTITEDAVETLIPIVMVLVEGGPSSIRTICQALDSNTPVVVVKDSGRAADLVAELHACYCDSESGGSSAHPSRPQTGFAKGNSLEADINTILTKARADNKWINEISSELCRVLNERKQLVTIFKFDSKRHNGNLEDAILEALFNAAKFSGDNNEQHRRTVELKLAMAWHKFEYARKNLLTDTTISKWKEDDLRRALVDALRRGHVDFVELLIEFGTPLEKLTNADLTHLYESAFIGARLPVKNVDRHSIRTKKEFYKDYFGSLFRKVGLSYNLPVLNDSGTLGKDAPRDLFFWALFLNRFQLATYLCSKNWNPTIAPLFGVHIYRRAARLTLDLDTKQQYEENANQFDVHATAIIDRCFDTDENFGVDLLKPPTAAFYSIKPLQIAQKGDCRSFLASKCVQRYLDNEWFGFINYKRKNINFRVFLCSLFVPLFPIFCFLLPYVRKGKKIAQSARDPSKTSQPTMIHNVVEPGERRGKTVVPLKYKITYFYQAPIVRFYYYLIFFVIFLVLFSFVMLVDYFPLNIYNGKRSGVYYLQIPITEMIVHICIWSLIMEELRQFIFAHSKREYISEIWNMIDILAIVIYLVGFITRFFVIESLFTISKIFMGLDLILWYVRTLHLFSAYEKLGPKLIMILNTMKDLLFFVCFILIFLLGFSVTSWSLITTTNQVNWTYADDGSLYNVTIAQGGSGLWSWQILRDVLNYGVWKVFGQVDAIDGTDAYSAVAFVLAMLFLAIANVLLLNVLVVLFNVTIRDVESQSHQIWRYQRFLLVFEYSEKPLLPPPVNFIYYLFVAIWYIITEVHSRCMKRRRADEVLIMDKIDVNENNIREEFKITDMMQRESAIADDYWRDTLKNGKKDQVEVALQNIERDIRDLKQRIHNNNQTSNHDQQWSPVDN